jgi:hypothetical protein
MSLPVKWASVISTEHIGVGELGSRNSLSVFKKKNVMFMTSQGLRGRKKKVIKFYIWKVTVLICKCVIYVSLVTRYLSLICSFFLRPHKLVFSVNSVLICTNVHMQYFTT